LKNDEAGVVAVVLLVTGEKEGKCVRKGIKERKKGYYCPFDFSKFL